MTAPAAADYTRLVTPEHRDKPRFLALVELLTSFAVDERTVIEHLPTDFDVDVAVGVQLDAIGLWVGSTRIITVEPSEAYPTPTSPYQVSLSDAIFRRLIKARAVANSWDGTPEGILPVLAAFYGPAGTYAAVVDNQDMSIDLYIGGVFPTAAEAAVFSQFLLPVRPSGVRVKNTWIAAPGGGPLFGLDIENLFIAGPDIGSFGVHF